MTRQYIGARYVPKFFDWDGSAEWRSGVAYEALTIVTRNGNSYTSKIPVPSNIGAPESNPAYWVSTGLYNEQVESLRQLAEGTATSLSGFMANGAIGTNNLADNAVTARKIADGAVSTEKIANNTITSDKLAPKYVICVGDSYQEGYDPQGNNKGWGYYLLHTFGYNGHNIRGVGGAGFGTNAGGQYDLSVILAKNPPTDISYDKVTDIVVGAGYNDFKRSADAINSGIARFYEHCKTRYPNAKIWLAPIGWTWTNNEDNITPNSVGRTYRTYMSACKNRDINFVNSCLGLLFGCNELSTDYKHPTENGNITIASAIHAAFNGLPYLSFGGSYNLPITTNGWSGSIQAIVSTVNGVATIRLAANAVNYSGDETTIMDLPISFAHHPFMCVFSAILAPMVSYDSHFANTPVSFASLPNGNCSFGLQLVNTERNNYVTASKISLKGVANYQPAFAVDVANA